MRTAGEYRDRQLEMLARALQRPGMFCGNVGDLFFGEVIRDLLWLEERPVSDSDCVSKLLGGSLGVYGQLHYQHHEEPDLYQNEVASTFAEAAYRLGYLNPKNVLAADQYSELVDSLTPEFFGQDHTQACIIERFGPPSHDVLGGQTTVHSYACADRLKEWVHFDYSRCMPPEDGVTYQWFDDAILRDVRRAENRFELLPFASWFHRADG